MRTWPALLFAAAAATMLAVCSSGGERETPGAPGPPPQAAPQETGTQQPPPKEERTKPEPREEKENRGPDFLEHAFPPTVSDTKWHRDAWRKDDCLRCHETGVGDAPRVRHRGMPDLLKTAKCRSCHVQIPGQRPSPKKESEAERDGFAPNAFPPMMPASASHVEAWTRDDCLLCHDNGISGAPKVLHRGLPPILKTAKCRSCHVQVRAIEAMAAGKGRR